MERRQEWAGGAKAESDRRFDAAHEISKRFEFGQPILIGHHSEGKARRDQERMHGNMDKAVEAHKRAEHHESKAAGIADQLERTIFDDDPDAIERLRERIAERRALADKKTAINKAWRKHKGDVAALVASGVVGQRLAETMAKTMAECRWLKSPMDATSERAAIRRDEERIAQIEARQKRIAAAEAAGGKTIRDTGEYSVVTFAEKPGRAILDALRGAGYRWSGDSWVGLTAALPEVVRG